MLSPDDITTLNSLHARSDPKAILQETFSRWPQANLSFSGAEDVALLDIAVKLQSNPAIFTLDTGRLHPETYQFLERVRKHYGIALEVLIPDTQQLQDLVMKKGLFSFYQDGHEECCAIRKVEPLRRKLANVEAWVTGQRRDQSPTRADVPIFQIDAAFSSNKHQVIKINPLANWSSSDVWNYIRMFDVPFNPLHDRGFISIGCEPCTRPVGPNQHEREGRWWWEEATIKECGLHRRPGAKDQSQNS